MRYGNRTLKRRILSSPLALVAALIVFVLLARATWGVYEKASQSAQRLAEAETELDKLKQHQDDLSRKVSYLSTDQGVEAEIRTKYRAVKEGESVAVIVDTDQTASAMNATSTAKVGWWGRLLQKIGL